MPESVLTTNIARMVITAALAIGGSIAGTTIVLKTDSAVMQERLLNSNKRLTAHIVSPHPPTHYERLNTDAIEGVKDRIDRHELNHK